MIKIVVSLMLVSFLLGCCSFSSRLGDGSFHMIIKMDEVENNE